MAGKSAIWGCEPDSEVAIKVGTDGPTALAPQTVPQLFKQNCAKFGDASALNVKRDGKWENTTFAQWYEQSMRLAKSLLAIGVKRFQGVSIMGFNSPEWAIANIGAILAGCLATGIYSTNNTETTQFILENSCCRVAFGQNSLLLARLLEAGKGIDGLKVVQYIPGPVEQSLKEKGVLSWDEFLALGKDVKDGDVESVMSSQKPGHCCTLIYTSGTTGMPKGVMLSHDNCVWTSAILGEEYKFKKGSTLVSYLPLSHIAGQIVDIYLPIFIGCTVYYAQPDALKGTLVESLKEVEPTIFLGVPRVWEKMKEKIEPAVRAGKVPPAAVKSVLGLGKAEILITASAPTPLAVLEFFESVNMTIYNVYGCSENSGPATLNSPKSNKVGSVGIPIIGTEVKLHKPDSAGEGELCLSGRYVMMGYLKSPEKTQAVLDEDGWYHTGDLARIDKEGPVWITGRLKELIVTSGGENIAPVSIEQEMKKELRLCSYCIVVGDGKNFLNMLVTLKSKIDENGLATDELDDEAVAICKGLGAELSKVSEAMESAPVKKYIQDGINRANERAISNAARVQKFAILPRDLSIPGEDLTPTAKLKRGYVTKKHAEVIEKFYK